MCVCKFVWVCVDDSLNVGAAREKIFSRQYLRMFEGEMKEAQKQRDAVVDRLASWGWNDGCRERSWPPDESLLSYSLRC